MFQTRQLLASGEETAYGLGWMLETVPLAGDPARMASHASLTPVGGSTSFVTFPERGLAVAVTANTSFKHLRFVALQIAEAFAR
jgi:CubicO group peptidase (beta-lactamase class C family)